MELNELSIHLKNDAKLKAFTDDVKKKICDHIFDII
jgi:hypothetical protein